MSTDLERLSLNSSSANSVASSARSLSANVKKLHNALNLLLSDLEREQFIHCLNVYHSKRNVYDLVQTLKVILNVPSKRQLLPMLRLVIPRSDQLLFDQYTSEGLYLKSDALARNGDPDGAHEAANSSPTHGAHFSAPSPSQAALRGSPDSISTSSDGTATLIPLLGRNFLPEPPGEIRQVILKRHKSNEGLGFSIRGGSEHGVGIYVSLVEPGSLAEKEGLRIGDQIMKVNDKVFDRVTHAEAVKVSYFNLNVFIYKFMHAIIVSIVSFLLLKQNITYAAGHIRSSTSSQSSVHRGTDCTPSPLLIINARQAAESVL